jgi:hypothetical protein
LIIKLKFNLELHYFPSFYESKNLQLHHFKSVSSVSCGLMLGLKKVKTFLTNVQKLLDMA